MLTGGIGQPGGVSKLGLAKQSAALGTGNPAISASGAVVSASVLTDPGHITGARYFPSALTSHAQGTARSALQSSPGLS